MTYADITRRFDGLSGNLKGAVLIGFAAFGFALMTLLIKMAGERLHVTQILFVRQAIMMLIVMPSVINHFPGCLKTERLDLQVVRVAFALVAMLTGFYAVIHMPLADAVAIGFAKSFFVTIFAILILYETVGIRRWAAVAIGFIGVVVMMRPGSD
ncbi:MAG: EamA family transporter, partial [Boseongicola sp.]